MKNVKSTVPRIVNKQIEKKKNLSTIKAMLLDKMEAIKHL